MSDQKLRIIVLDKQSKYLAAIKQELERTIPQKIEVIVFPSSKQSESYVDIHKEQCAVLLASYDIFDNSIETFLTYKQELSPDTQIILLTVGIDSNILSLLQNKLVFDLQKTASIARNKPSRDNFFFPDRKCSLYLPAKHSDTSRSLSMLRGKSLIYPVVGLRDGSFPAKSRCLTV